MQERRVPRVATVFMIVHDAMLGFWGLLLWILPERVLAVSAQSFLGRSWDSVAQSDSRLSQLVVYYMRFWGMEGLLMAVALALITVFPYRRGVRWAWISLLVCCSLGWVAAIALDVQLSLLSITYIEIVPLLLCWTSLAIAGRTVFSNRRVDSASATL